MTVRIPTSATALPYDIADAMAVLTDPARHRLHPAVIETNWLFLKQARGQDVDFARIGPPAHLCSAPAALAAAHRRPAVPPQVTPPVAAPAPASRGGGALARRLARGLLSLFAPAPAALRPLCGPAAAFAAGPTAFWSVGMALPADDDPTPPRAA